MPFSHYTKYHTYTHTVLIIHITISPLTSNNTVRKTPQRHAKCNKAPTLTPSSHYYPHTLSSPHELHPNHTHQNSNITTAKNPTHTLHPTPVFSAILNMRLIVPRSLFREFSNWSFIFSVSAVESRISSPMRCVNYSPRITSASTFSHRKSRGGG